MTTRIIEIGVCSDHSNAVDPAIEFEEIHDKEVFTVDIDPALSPDLVHDIREPFPEKYHQAFDIAVMSHVLEHIEFKRAMRAAFNVAQCLKMYGFMLVVVPSLEWACEQVLAGGLDVVTFAMLYGGQENEWDYHRSSFTLDWLREMYQELGFIEREAKTMEFFVVRTDDEGKRSIPALQNVYIGQKVENVEVGEDG